MALPTTGLITLQDLQTEYGGSTPILLSNYYSTGSLVPVGQQGRPNGVRGNIPTGGSVDLNIYHGSVKVVPASSLYDGNSIGSTSPTSTLTYNYAVDGRGINTLHLVAWGAGGAGATWPAGAPGGYGGACYRISFVRGQSTAIDNLLDSITNINGYVGDKGHNYQNGSWPDISQAGGPGGSSAVFINNSATMLVLAKGGHGARASFTNNDTSYLYPTNSGTVGEDIIAPGSNATYAGGGGGSGGGSGGSSVYGGSGALPGNNPGGGGSGIDNNSDGRVVGGQGRVRIIINGSAPF